MCNHAFSIYSIKKSYTNDILLKKINKKAGEWKQIEVYFVFLLVITESFAFHFIGFFTNFFHHF